MSLIDHKSTLVQGVDLRRTDSHPDYWYPDRLG